MDWLNKLSLAIDYIENNLDGDISYDECARIACCSSFYFQRMFSYISGVSLSEYIRRRRMTKAAFLLKTSDFKVIDIALKYGYTSPSSFTRAFRSVHNISPSQARNPDSVVSSYARINFSIELTGDEPLTYSFKDLDEFYILGYRFDLEEDMVENQRKVPLFWKKFFNSSLKNKLLDLNRNAKNIYGITKYKDSNEIFYYIGILLDNFYDFKFILEDLSDDLYLCKVEKSKWVAFENTSDFKTGTIKIFKNFYKEWLVFSNYSYGFLPDVEVYPLDDTNPASKSQVLISIKEE